MLYQMLFLNIFNVLLWFHFIDNCFTSAEHVEEALDVRVTSCKKELNQKYTRTEGRENDLLQEERQRGYHKCLQDGWTFLE